MRESNIAPFLTELQARVKNEGIRVGSYPQLTRGVYVSLIGPDERRVREVGEEVVLPDLTITIYQNLLILKRR
jgi:hypothetical protein